MGRATNSGTTAVKETNPAGNGENSSTSDTTNQHTGASESSDTTEKDAIDIFLAEAQRIMDEAKAAANEIIASAKASAAFITANVTADTPKANADNPVTTPAQVTDPQRLVKIKLFKDSKKYKEPLFVSVGDYRAAIPRGVECTIPYYVAKHIEEMQAQDESTASLIGSLVAEYDNGARQVFEGKK